MATIGARQVELRPRRGVWRSAIAGAILLCCCVALGFAVFNLGGTERGFALAFGSGVVGYESAVVFVRLRRRQRQEAAQDAHAQIREEAAI